MNAAKRLLFRPDPRLMLLGLVLAAAASPAALAKSQRLVLVDRGRPQVTIVVPGQPTAIDRRAADILQS